VSNLTQKQEAFCLAYIETGNASEAYRRAGYSQNAAQKTIHEAASRLLADGKVSARVKELQGEVAKRFEITVDRIAEMLHEDRAFARECATPAAAVSATMGLAKLGGLLTDKTELTGKDGAAIQLEQVKNDAQSFTSAVAGLASRNGTASQD